MCEIAGCTEYAVYADVEDYNYLCQEHYTSVVTGKI